MRSNQRYESVRSRAAVARCVALIILWCAAAATIETAGAAGAHTGPAPADQMMSSREPLREQIKSLLVEGSEPIVASMLANHLAEHPDDALMQYNAACIHARLGNLAEAEQHLRLAIKHGFLQFSIMKRDPDLVPLHDSAVYQSIMAARDAADNLITDRRNTHWLSELQGNYRLRRDVERKIDVISTADDETFAATMTRIAEIADVEARFFNIQLRHRITIVLLEDAEAERIFGSSNIRGNYRHEMRDMIVSNAGRSLQHELAHAFHHTQMDELGQNHPIWVQEGLACLFEAYRVSENGTIEFLPNDRHTAMRYILQSQQFENVSTDMRDLMCCGEDRFKQDAPVCYPMARSIMEYIAATEGIEEWYQKYIANFAAEPTGQASLVALAGESLSEVESSWKRWVIERDGGSSAPQTASEPIRVVSRPQQREVQYTGRIVAQASVSNDIATTPIVIRERDLKASAMYQAIRPLVLAGQYEQVMPALRDLLEEFPEHSNARFDLALAYIKTGDRDAARSEYEQLKTVNANLAQMVLACLDRPMTVAPRSAVVVKPNNIDAEAQAGSVNTKQSDARLDHLAPPIQCDEINY